MQTNRKISTLSQPLAPLRTAIRFAVVAILCLTAPLSFAEGWWDKEWTARKAFTIDSGPEAGAIDGEIGGSVVLIRLHQGNFSFGQAREDGSDIRFVAEDGKTELPYQIERYDSLMNEAFVWVWVAGIKAGGETKFHLYYGNLEAAPPAERKTPYDDDTTLVYHFAEKGAPAADSSEYGNTAETAGTASEGSMIASGIRLLGATPVVIPPSESLNWEAGSPFTWSAWIKPAALAPSAVIFDREDGANALRIGLDQGVPYVEVKQGADIQRSPGGAPLDVNTWKHLAVAADGTTIRLYVDGAEFASFPAAVPALKSGAKLGGEGGAGFLGELDQLEISRVARPPGFIALAAASQSGTERSAKLLAVGEDEGGEAGGHNEMLEHVMIFGDIAGNMMFDGWIVIFCCVIMAIVGWTVAAQKLIYLNRIQKGSEEFLRQWWHLASDLTSLDHSDPENVKSLGGKADPKIQRLVHLSPLYHIYSIGSEEIRHRLQRCKGNFMGLSGRSIQAIRASLDAGLIRETHRMNNGLVFLTISIAGGPYVGLLGTVVGVMVTFAVIAKSGEVEVNSIAPGIASALLATVAGLLVAIPALFIYSYLNSRIRESISAMQMFIDEFVTKMAEFYPASAEEHLPVQRLEVNDSRPENQETAGKS